VEQGRGRGTLSEEGGFYLCKGHRVSSYATADGAGLPKYPGPLLPAL